MRQRAAASDVVIVNHHLLCADAAVRQSAYGEVIPACHAAVIDEAHQLEDVATQYFGFSVSNHRLDELAHDAERLQVADRRDRTTIARSVEGVREAARSFFSELALAHQSPEQMQNRSRRTATGRNRSEERVRATAGSLGEIADAAASLTGALDRLEGALERTAAPRADSNEEPADERIADDREALSRRARELRNEIRFLVRAADSDYVYFVEFRGRGVFLRALPIDVSSLVRDMLMDRMRTTVLTSATLTVDGTFEYLRSRLGIRSAAEIRLPSEFDFGRQAVLYLPPNMPDPRSPGFAMAAGREVVEILKRTLGRAFVLFTSYATLRDVQAIAEMALDFPILVQGAAPRSQLLRQFRQTPHAVLFATSSFWQGVDVAGDALSCVIVDKLPFASPGDPVTSARIDAIRARGGEPFDEYQVPLAILALQQGLGRLIRHRRDRGVLAVLDPRLRTKGYGRRFLASLPPAPVVLEIGAIDAFFSIV
jgi:ATP-dependent DNA helicase DinG